jgi:hypothetical protein
MAHYFGSAQVTLMFIAAAQAVCYTSLTVLMMP